MNGMFLFKIQILFILFEKRDELIPISFYEQHGGQNSTYQYLQDKASGARINIK